MVFTHGIPTAFRNGVHLFMMPSIAVGLVPTLSGHAIAYDDDGVHHHRESAGSQGTALLVTVTDAAFSGFTMDQLLFMCLSFSTPTVFYWYVVPEWSSR